MGKLKGFLFFLLVLAAVVGGGVIGLRYSRDKVAPVIEVKPNLVATKHMGSIYVYGARVGDHVILFDSGADSAAHPVDAILTQLKASHADVKDIFLTHGHFDHVAGALQFPDARTYLGAGDVGLATGKESPDGLLVKLMTAVLAAPPLPRITNPLKEKAAVDVGGGKSVLAIPVPGHTRGSFAYLFDGVLFPGDIMLLKEGRLEPTPSMFDAHPEENRASIRALKKQLADQTIDRVCTAHGGCTPAGLGENMLNDLVNRLGGG
ncbi:MAG TPA: MBL fold metallo-hydrolase [Polyangia bacterium]|jgi:glyoxylase-like metal-dependent hydrolase (beta-lactamase superfamily II)|nr:MBL fold metallo-hydrolase [Polyangia bacterium]